MRDSWPTLQHVFSVGASTAPGGSTLRYGRRYKPNLLATSPVDLLVVHQGGADPPIGARAARPDHWESLVTDTTEAARPKLVLESWPWTASGWEHGPMNKARRVRWESLGYTSRYRLMSTTAHGGALDQKRLMVARIQPSFNSEWTWPTPPPTDAPRPMGNLLTPWGLLPRHVRGEPVPPKARGPVPDSTTDPMPHCWGAWISTPHGTRRLQPDELSRGLGMNLKATPDLRPTALGLRYTTSLFIWEGLGHSLAALGQPTPRVPPRATPIGPGVTASPPPNHPPAQDAPFHWAPPNLTPGSIWHTNRLNSLRRACSRYPDGDKLYAQGLVDLAVHRLNYDHSGPP
jgi:hypothetical protein